MVSTEAPEHRLLQTTRLLARCGRLHLLEVLGDDEPDILQHWFTEAKSGHQGTSVLDSAGDE